MSRWIDLPERHLTQLKRLLVTHVPEAWAFGGVYTVQCMEGSDLDLYDATPEIWLLKSLAGRTYPWFF